MTRTSRYGIAVAAGAVLGIVGARVVFVGSWLSLIPWGLAGAAIGASSPRLRSASATGAVYGFSLTMAFMIAGYTGSASLVSRLPFFLIIALVGAVCGLTSAIIGRLVTRSLRPRPAPRGRP